MFSHTIRQTSTVHGPLARSARYQIPALGELDVQAAQMGLQPGVLDGNQVGGLIGLAEVRVPHARGRREGITGLPVNPDRVDDGAAFIEPGSQQRVAAAGCWPRGRTGINFASTSDRSRQGEEVQ